MDAGRVLSILFAFLVSLDLELRSVLQCIPGSFISHLGTINSNNEFRTINCKVLLPFVGAFDIDEVKVPGFRDFRLREQSQVLSLNGVPLKLTEESDLSQDLLTENSVVAESEDNSIDREDSIEISRSIKPQTLERLKAKFLSLFGMTQIPRRGGKPLKVPNHLIKIYEMHSGNEFATSNLNIPGRHIRTANTIRTFYAEPGSSRQSHSSEGDNSDMMRLKFNLNSMPTGEVVTGAELRLPFILHKDMTKESEVGVLSQLRSVKILIHDVVRPATAKNSKKPQQYHLKEPISFPVDTKTVQLSKRRNGTSTFTLTFDVFPAVSRWLVNSEQDSTSKGARANHGLLVQIFGVTNQGQILSQEQLQHRSHHVRVKRELEDESSEGTEVGAASPVTPRPNEQKSAVLFTYSDDGHTGRKTRDAKTLSRQYRAARQRRRKNHRNKNRNRNLCDRHTMFVDFTDVGWNDWIVAPPGYHAYHCSGECPFPMADHLNATNHAVIQALVNSMNPGLVPPPCCVPTKYSSLSLLYTDSSDKIVLKNYNEMVVDSCGCS